MARPPPDYVRPPWLKFLRKHIWIIAFVVGAVTITAIRPLTRHIPDPPALLFELPAFELVDHTEQAFTTETLKGKVWVFGFIFTSCPSSCPAVTRAMADLREAFDRDEIDVEMVSLTVDPERDTPGVLREYADRVGAGEGWRFVTGDPEAVQALVTGGFKIGVGDREDRGGGTYDISHSTKLALVDGDGGVRGYYGTEEDDDLPEIFARAHRLLQEQRREARERGDP